MLDGVLRHDRTLVVAGLATVIALSWIWLLIGAGLHMDKMDMGGGQIMLMAPPWTAGYAAMILLMWIIMMAAMMLPSAAPAILLVAALTRQGDKRQAASSSTQFTLGYVAVWGAFSLIATGLQWGLDRAGLLTDTMASGSAVLAASLLIAAGIYQWTPWKQACLKHCRSRSILSPATGAAVPWARCAQGRGTARSASDVAGC
jgi:predicted metal-binding membrane protein